MLAFPFFELRDIFRINLDTACNTHDLLECICDNPSAGQMEDSARMASDEDDEDEDPKGFIAASQVKPGVLTKTDREVKFQPNF